MSASTTELLRHSLLLEKDKASTIAKGLAVLDTVSSYLCMSLKSLETGNILRFVAMMENSLRECLRLLKPEGHCFFVCGTASSELRGKKVKIRTAELVIYAAKKVKHNRYQWQVENYIEDKVVLKRGSYFAVRSNGDINNRRRRVSEDDVVSLVKVRR